jgi:chromosome partitioning protein
MLIVCGKEKGGVGATSLAENIALRIRQEGASVILVDTDSTGTLSGWSAIREAEEVDPPISVVKAANGAWTTIRDLAMKFDAVVIDVGARDYARLAELAKVVDFWLAPTQISQGDLDSTVNLCTALQQLDKQRAAGRVPVHVVLNRVPTGWNSTEEEDARSYLAEYIPGVPVLAASIKDRKAWRDAGKTGRGVSELPRRDAAKAADDFEALYLEIRQAIQLLAQKEVA